MMKKKILTAGVILFSFLPVICLAQDPSGRQIVQTQKDRHRVSSARDTSVMLLIDKKGNRKVREIKRFGKDSDTDLKKTLLVFTAPADLKGTTLMTWEITKGAYKQWMFLPGQTALKRIASSARRSSFMGSDFTFEDLQPDNMDNYNFSTPETQVLEGQDCFVIDITPATDAVKKTSSYGRRRVWVRKDIYFTVKIEFYDRRDRLVKTQTCRELTHSHGTVWYAGKVLMENHKTKHKTLMGIKTKEVNIPVDDNLFSEKTILSGKHI